MSKIDKVMIFDNGNIAVFDSDGKQVPSLQEPWLNYKALMELTKRIAKDKPNIEGTGNLPPVVNRAFHDYLNHFNKLVTPKVEKE
jgi:hypothetical protein